VQRAYVMLAPGERLELWADFSQQAIGTELTLQSLAYTGVEAGMMGMMGTVALPNGTPFAVMNVRVEKSEVDPRKLPDHLATIERYQAEAAVNRDQPRAIALGMANGQWTLNNQTFAMDTVTPEETVQLGSMELWEFINEMNAGGMMGGGGMMNQGQMGSKQMGGMMDFMAHAMHIHGVQFQVLARQVDPAQIAGWQTVKAGFVDEGWKDTVLVMPGERVKVAMRFSAYRGLYLYHCHMLEHEDRGMMRNYLVA